MGNALAIYEKIAQPIAFCDAMAETCAAVTGCSLQQGKAVALTCLCEGITPHEYARTYHNIQGKSAMRADAMLATFRGKHGGSHRIVERSENRAAIELTNAEGEKYSDEFTWAQAQQSRWPWKDHEKHEKGLKDNWSTPTDRKAMLWARLVSDSIRAFAPEVVAGIYTPEELVDADVVDSRVVTHAPRRTVEEAIAIASASQAAAPQQQPDETVVVEGEIVEDAPFNAAIDDPAPFATQAQIDRLNQLREKLNPPQQVWDEALAKRGATTVHGLKKADAQDLIDKLESHARQLESKAAGKN